MSHRSPVHRWRGSLRLRLLVGTLSWILLTIAATAWGLSNLFSQHVVRQFEAELGNHLNQLAALIAVDETGRPLVATPLSDPRLNRPYSGLYWQIDEIQALDDASDVTLEAPLEPAILRSRSLWDAVLRVPQDVPADGELHSHRIEGPNGETLHLLERVLRPADDPDLALRLMIAADQAWITEPVARFNTLLIVSLGILATGLVGAAVLQVRSGLAPLNRIGAALTEVRNGHKSRIEGRFPTEIQPLVDEFNGVLARNAEVVERARTQAGNLAHALKTPLAVLANAAAQASSPLATLVGEQVERARTQVDHHLARARAAGAAGIPGQYTPVRPVVEALIRVMGKVHADRNLHISLEHCDPSLTFHGEAQDLQEMIGNLLDNACKWSRSRVEIEASQHAHQLLIQIRDDGPGIPESSRATVLARGVRADEKVSGSGLGLAIVSDLATLYGGELAFESAALGGLDARLTVPCH